MQKLMKTDIPELNTFMSACPADVQTDFHTLGNWFKFWKAQGEMKVYSTAYKNVVGNMAAIKADVKTLEGYFDSQDWYDAAKEASTIAKIALPVSSFENVGTSCGDFTIDQKSMADYLAGFIHGFTGEDDRADLEANLVDDGKFQTDICTAVNDFRTKDNQKVLEGVKTLLGDLPNLKTDISGCSAKTKTDMGVVGNWFNYWKAQGEMKVYSTAYKNVVGNMAQIKTLAGQIETKYDAGDYYGVADIASSIAKIALPLPSQFGVNCGDFTIDQKSMADYIAGFISGFTGHDDRTDMEACLKDDLSFQNDICSVVNNIRTKDNQKVLEAVQTLLHDLPEITADVSTCPANVQDDIHVVGGWFKYWKAQGEMKVYQTAYSNVMHDFEHIKTIASDIETKYDANDFFGVAVDASTIAKIALPLQAMELFLQ